MTVSAKIAYIANRLNIATDMTWEQLAASLPVSILSNMFFTLDGIEDAEILKQFRSITDDYLSGRIGRDEARALLREYARASGKDDGTESLKNLASTARLELILDQNVKMARAVYRHERMYSPAALRVFPYVRYRAGFKNTARCTEHQKYDGLIFHKDDPWLRSHTPPYSLSCECELEQATEKQAAQAGGPTVISTPTEQDNFPFDPATFFVRLPDGSARTKTSEELRDNLANWQSSQVSV